MDKRGPTGDNRRATTARIMPQTHPKADAHFATLTAWRGELLALRALLLASPLAEDWKWSAPVYTWQGGNVAILWGFSDRATLGFFKGVLLRDPEGILVAPGPHSRSSRVVSFTDPAQVAARAGQLRALIDEAIGIQRAGRKVDLPQDDLACPEELAARLRADPVLAAAFAALTPGRRRGWLLHVGAARQARTREDRIDRATPRILAGKGMQDR
ncbi:YdeI/OmpD-associated family protein [Paracoccus spongiarum]|uniref:YdeI/OmpD-associated family protein n=1 Tax=Paracoccus spongiarum TaxID=3064387 RepID=A0ABT9JC04_9RHOB|nr:YdeI/OmpD-associated family protein [Paracoccus sp. 2205BS29-5]MDP5307345.1 YdeI/OmpD-associated family protein [Paracoccus sp. 2205BS29-5]